MISRKYFVICFLFYIIVNNVSYSQNVSITIKTSGSTDANILDNQSGIPPFPIIRELFTNRDFDFYTNASTNLGQTFIWSKLGTTSVYHPTTVFAYEVRWKDNDNVIPLSKLEFFKFVTGKAAKSWEGGQVVMDSQYTFSSPNIFDEDIGLASWMYVSSNGIEMAKLDTPGPTINVYDNAEHTRYRISFVVMIRNADTQEFIASRVFRVQVEGQWPSSGWIQHTSSFLQVDTAWSAQDLDISLWDE